VSYAAVTGGNLTRSEIVELVKHAVDTAMEEKADDLANDLQEKLVPIIKNSIMLEIKNYLEDMMQRQSTLIVNQIKAALPQREDSDERSTLTSHNQDPKRHMTHKDDSMSTENFLSTSFTSDRESPARDKRRSHSSQPHATISGKSTNHALATGKTADGARKLGPHIS
jgi:actin-related protein